MAANLVKPCQLLGLLLEGHETGDLLVLIGTSEAHALGSLIGPTLWRCSRDPPVRGRTLLVHEAVHTAPYPLGIS